MNLKNVLPVAFASVMLLASCGEQPKAPQKVGIDLANMDTTAAVGTDFYQYACGGWIKNHPLTAEYSRFGIFNVLDEQNKTRLKELIEGIAGQPQEEGTVAQKIGDLYNLAMDSVKLNEDGFAPISEQLEKIAAIKEKSEIIPMMASLYAQGISCYFNAGVGADIMDSKMNLFQIEQGGINLGQKEYYIDTDSVTTNIREKYKQHIVNLFKLVGVSEEEATKQMEAVMEIETAIAKASLSATELRDPAANYHKMSYDDLKNQFKEIDWDAFMKGVGVPTIAELSVGQIEPLKKVAELINTLPVEKHIAYMQWNVIDGASNFLSDDFVNESFDFYGKTLSGRQENQPRWKRAINTVNGSLGEAVGQMYVEKFFPAAAKERMLTLVKNLQTALGERIQAQEWMSDSNKVKAMEKLNTFHVKIGYPDKWKDYSSLAVAKDTYWANVLRVQSWKVADNMNKAGRPVDPEEWFMTPQTINAYYNPTTNEICFPAAILQYPFFDMNADDAMNYGAIGVVIGHEMTHGFDDQGRQFDKEGNLRDWWQASDAEQFKSRAQVLVDFFNNIEVLPGLKANGQLTLGENLADHGGLMVSYQAFQNAMKSDSLGVENGFTPEQRFFLAYATVWAQNIRDEQIRVYTKSDPHSIGKWRVNGTLPHIQAWYDAFHITPNDPLYVAPENRVTIW